MSGVNVLNRIRIVGLGLALTGTLLAPASVAIATQNYDAADPIAQGEGMSFGSDTAIDSSASDWTAVLEAESSPSLPLWGPTPTATVAGFEPQHVADVTGDGRDDVIGIDGDVFVIPGGDSSPGTLQAYPLVTHGWFPPSGVGDVTGDGVADVVVGFLQDPYISVYPGGVTGGLGTRVDYSVEGVLDIEVVDVNGDNRDDIVFRELTDSSLQFLIQSASGDLDRVDFVHSPDLGTYEEFASGDFDGDGLLDFVVWPGYESGNSSGDPRIFTQTTSGTWELGGAIGMDGSDHKAWAVASHDLDDNGADEIVVSVNVEGASDRYALIYWQTTGGLNTSESSLADCRLPSFSFADVDGDGRTDMGCTGDQGVLVYRQMASQSYVREFYLNHDFRNTAPLFGNVVGDARIDLATTYTDGSFSAHIRMGLSESLIAQGGVIGGAFTTDTGNADGMCVEAVSTHSGVALATDVSVGSAYSLAVPQGMYVLKYYDCRPQPRSPHGMSFIGNIRGGSDPEYFVVTAGSAQTVDMYTELRGDMTGTIVDDVSGEPLDGIRVWQGIRDWGIGGAYWIVSSSMTDASGRFVKYGSYRQIDLFIDDPLEVYPSHTLYVSTEAPDIGTWGLVDPVMRDIRDSIFLGDILWLRESGVTKGCNPPANDMFCTDERVTRGQMAAFLTRFLELSGSSSEAFTDDDGSIFEANIEILAAAGITRGCNPPVNDQFCPNAFVTRGQMAAFLVRALGLTDEGVVDFVDDDGSVFEEAIAKFATAGITKGCNPPVNDQFCPNAFVTRGQMAAFLSRASRLRS